MENVQENNAQDIQNECLQDLNAELELYFRCLDGTKEIRDVFWWLLFFAISNTENHNTRDQTGIQMTFYYMTLNLLATLEKYHQAVSAENKKSK